MCPNPNNLEVINGLHKILMEYGVKREISSDKRFAKAIYEIKKKKDGNLEMSWPSWQVITPEMFEEMRVMNHYYLPKDLKLDVEEIMKI